jgi:phosphatidyl-myo-inositol dimannoside synthase
VLPPEPDGPVTETILALFPSFEAEPFGGVQVSGREALRSITAMKGPNASAFYYEPRESKAENLWKAIRSRRRADTLLVWHSAMLRLAPLIAASNRRLVVFLHGIEAWRMQDSLTRFLMHRTDLFLSNSDYTWNRFAAMHADCGKRPHRTIHLGLGDVLKTHMVPPDAIPSAVMVGRLRREENYKGHSEMIEIWPRVLAAMPDAELRIIGDGDLRPDLENLALRSGVAHRVRFYGSIPDTQKESLLRESRVLVLPSRAEGFGLVYLEAMRLGRPCIVSDLDAGREVVNPPEAGLAVNPEDPARMVEALLEVLTPGPAWDEMSTRALRRYESNFTAAKFRQRLQGALASS